MSTQHWWDNTDMGKWKYLREKSVSLLLYPPQILYGLAWDQTQASTLRNHWLSHGTVQIL